MALTDPAGHTTGPASPSPDWTDDGQAGWDVGPWAVIADPTGTNPWGAIEHDGNRIDTGPAASLRALAAALNAAADTLDAAQSGR